jgi:hypothetical protein
VSPEPAHGSKNSHHNGLNWADIDSDTSPERQSEVLHFCMYVLMICMQVFVHVRIDVCMSQPRGRELKRNEAQTRDSLSQKPFEHLSSTEMVNLKATHKRVRPGEDVGSGSRTGLSHKNEKHQEGFSVSKAPRFHELSTAGESERHRVHGRAGSREGDRSERERGRWKLEEELDNAYAIRDNEPKYNAPGKSPRRQVRDTVHDRRETRDVSRYQARRGAREEQEASGSRTHPSSAQVKEMIAQQAPRDYQNTSYSPRRIKNHINFSEDRFSGGSPSRSQRGFHREAAHNRSNDRGSSSRASASAEQSSRYVNRHAKNTRIGYRDEARDWRGSSVNNSDLQGEKATSYSEHERGYDRVEGRSARASLREAYDLRRDVSSSRLGKLDHHLSRDEFERFRPEQLD